MKSIFFISLKKAFACILFSAVYLSLSAGISNIGIPVVRYYTKEQYKAGMQNWSIVQGSDGVMYFGNNYGLLEFNGKEWNLVLQPTNKTIVRSMAIDNKGTMFVGAQNDFGWVKTNIYGRKQFVSLSGLLDPADKGFSDIWNICTTSEGTWFYSSEIVFLYNGKTLRAFKSPNSFIGCYKIHDTLLVQDGNKDIFSVSNNGLKKIISSSDIHQMYIRNIFPSKDGKMIVVSDNDIMIGRQNDFKSVLPGYLKEYLQKNKAYSSIMLRNGYFVIGTVRDGLLILDKDFSPVQVINSNNGLKNNTILALASDDIGNLWVATDNGIGYIEIATPLYKIEKFYNLEGSVYSILETANKLFVGTNSGLYASNWKNSENPLKPTLSFNLVADLSGQVWNIYEIQNSIYVCHNEGMFRLDGNSKAKVSDVSGTWNLLKINHTNFYIQGTYYGFVVYELKNGRLVFRNKVKGFNESSRIIELDEFGNLWMAHGYKGVFKIKLNNNLDSVTQIHFYDHSKGFPTSVFINMFKVRNELLFGTEFGVYYYSGKQDSMLEDPRYIKILGNSTHIRLMKDNENNDVWFVKGRDMGEDIGIIHFYDDGKYEITENPFQRLKGKLVPGFECLEITSSEHTLFGTENGLVIYDKDVNRNYQKSFEAFVTKVKGLSIDTVLYGFSQTILFGKLSEDSLPQNFHFKLNSLSFSYSASYYEDIENIVYRTFLEGFDKTWTDWDSRNERQFTNLDPGKYKFHVIAKNIYGAESNEAIYEFEINPPWYKSRIAIAFYILLTLGILYLIVRYILWYIENEKKKLRIYHINEMRKKHSQNLYEKLMSENKIKTLSEEKLINDLNFKNSQLASTNLSVMQINEAFLSVKEELLAAMLELEPEQKKSFRRIIVGIDNKLKQKENWENFELHFDAVHNDFLRRLKIDFHDLNHRDIRLCAYLRLNLSSKEISNLMGISLRGIESIRYRVRRKIKLKTNDSLTDFLLQY